MKKKVFKIVKDVVFVAVIVILSVAVSGLIKHNATLKSQVKSQSEIIDSLLNRKEIVVNVSLNVTDKSTHKIQGKKNSGTINMPQENTYTIKLDSGTINALK